MGSVYERALCLEGLHCIFKSLLNAKIISEAEYEKCIRYAARQVAPEFECLCKRT